MTSIAKVTVSVAALAAFLFAPALADAQDGKVRVSLGGGVTAGAIDGESALLVSTGYRFSKLFSFDLEVLDILAGTNDYPVHAMNVGNVQPTPMGRPVGGIGMMPAGPRGGQGFGRATPRFLGPPMPVPGGVFMGNDRDTQAITLGFRFEVPTSELRFRPYVSSGMGVIVTEDRGTGEVVIANPQVRASVGPSVIDPNVPSATHAEMAANLGVGASVRLFKELAVGVDARVYRLGRGRNLGTIGGGLSYRF